MPRQPRKHLIQTKHKPPAYLSKILNSLNVASLLEQVQARPPARLLCFGPQAIQGTVPSQWMAVVVWHRPPGLYNYKSITLFGIWVIGPAATPRIVAGTKRLAYTEGFYNPESYFHQIRHNFQVYYGGDASAPSPAGRLYDQPYDSARRLDMRRELQAIVAAWREQQHGDTEMLD